DFHVTGVQTCALPICFDQKSLRLKYGQFMGDESEGTIAENIEMPEHDDEDPEDPLAEFTHDHDGNNDHNLVVHDHDEEEDEENRSEERRVGKEGRERG